jgi:hypothetical protein
MKKNKAGQTSGAETSRASTRAIHFKYFQDICHAIGCHISTCSIPIASRLWFDPVEQAKWKEAD